MQRRLTAGRADVSNTAVTIIAHSLKQLDPSQSVKIEARQSPFRLSRTIPLALAVWFLLDLGLRFAPLDWLNLYPFQIAARRPERYAPFIPNQSIQSPRYIGEMALKANLPPSEHWPPMRFTTDRLGFRATPRVSNPQGPPILLMEGDSFTFGAGLSDDQTFAAALARELNVNVYNGGRFFTDPERLKELDWLLPRLGSDRPGSLVYVLVESSDLDLSRGYDQKLLDRLGRGLVGTDVYTGVKEELRYLVRYYQLWMPISPVKILATRFHKLLADDKVLPNAYRRSVLERRLNGQRFLLEQKYVNRYLHQPSDTAVQNAAHYLAWLRGEVEKRGLDFSILLLPESASVYGRWLFGENNPGEQTEHFFNRLEKALKEHGIRSVNGFSILRSGAADEISKRELSYFREDHHWSPSGVRKLARATADSMPASTRGGNASLIAPRR